MYTSTPDKHGAAPPAGALAATTFISLVTFAVQVVYLGEKLKKFRCWRDFTLTHWLVLIIYFDSALFVLSSAVLSHGFGLNTSQPTCATAILICLTCYMSSKALIYYFLVEKVYIVTGIETPRLKSKLYCFNCFGMLIIYGVIIVINFMYRISRFDRNGMCIIGMERKAMIPLVIFDVVVNVYLTALFLVPMRRLHIDSQNPSPRLRKMALRTFIGSCCTLASSVANIVLVMVFNGERAWMCLMLCNIDVLFSVLVLNWVTSRDSTRRRGGSRTVDTTWTMATRNTRRSDFPRIPTESMEAPMITGAMEANVLNEGKENESLPKDSVSMPKDCNRNNDEMWRAELEEISLTDCDSGIACKANK